MNDVYRPYYLTDNPFPADPSLNLSHLDRRVNGTIFNEHIFEDELKELDKRLGRHTNLIYCQNMAEFIRGVGKSAIIAHTWRKYKAQGGNITSIYIRCQKRHMPTTLAAQVIRKWHDEGSFWKTLTRCVNGYAQVTPSSEIAAEGARLLTEQQWPVGRVDLRAFLCYNPSRLVNSLTDWACNERKALSPDIAAAFFRSYLSSPRDFFSAYPKVLRQLKGDEIEMLRNALDLMELGDFEYHYLFFDQFEDQIYGLSGRDLILFSTEMRRLLEAGAGRVSIIVTLHAGAVQTLAPPEAHEFATLAPLDGRHSVDVKPLEPAAAETLAITYLQEFRSGTPPDPLYPLTAEVVSHIHEVAEGNIRGILTGLSLCIQEGIDADYPPITLKFLREKHEEITGKISPERINL